MTDIQSTLQRALASRHAPEARALYLLILKYVDRRAHATWRNHYRDLLTKDEVEELVAETLVRLMSGALMRFHGETEEAFYAFLRTVTVRTVREAALKRLREREGRERLGRERRETVVQAPEIRTAAPTGDIPLSATDQEWLRELFRAGSRAELARQRGQSRAAITRMVQRIRSRIEALPDRDQVAVRAWMHREARALAPPS